MHLNINEVRPIGFGMMNFTCIPDKKFTQQEFNKTFKEIVDGSGASIELPILVNGGEFYGVPDRHEGLQLLGKFFETYPQYADIVVLSIKAGTTPQWTPDTSYGNLKAAVEVIDKYLQPLFKARTHLPKRLDIFCVARVGEEPIEDVIKTLETHKNNGKISKICLSEVSAATLARAVSAGSVDAIEIEFSLFHHDAIDNGLFEICVKHNILVVGYSPLGKGVLVGKTVKDLSEHDFRNHLDKFADQRALDHNNALVNFLEKLSSRSSIPKAQIALSWILTVSESSGKSGKLPKVVPIPGGTNASRQLSNFQSHRLSPELFDEIQRFLENFKTAGFRYNKEMDRFTSR